ncbi:MAG: hypothetical protein R3C17_15300 [Planctomycetaceae bacterium]
MAAWVVSYVIPDRFKLLAVPETASEETPGIWLTELFRGQGWLSLFHFLKPPFAARNCDGLTTDAVR